MIPVYIQIKGDEDGAWRPAEIPELPVPPCRIFVNLEPMLCSNIFIHVSAGEETMPGWVLFCERVKMTDEDRWPKWAGYNTGAE